MQKINIKTVGITLTGDYVHLFSVRKALDPQYNVSGSTGYSD